MEQLYFIYDQNRTAESNISDSVNTLFNWINRAFLQWEAQCGNEEHVMESISSAALRLASAVEALTPRDLHDQAVDAMRQELAHLVTENARLTRLLAEQSKSTNAAGDKSTNDAGDNQ